MKLERIDIKGLTRYEEACVDYAALGEGLIAIAGPNGAGKTTLMEAPFAALHLEMPTRPGGLAGVCHGKDAGIDLHFSNGAPYRALVAVDAVARTSEAYLYNGDGSPITSGKVREYAAEVERRFGSPALFLSACLSAQNKRGSFLDLSKADRKDLLAEILDTGGLQALAEAAREKGKETGDRLLRIRAEIAAGEREIEALPQGDSREIRGRAKEMRMRQASLQERLSGAREEYGRVRASLDQAEAAAREHQARAREHAEAQASLVTIQTKREELAKELRRLEERISSSQEACRKDAARRSEYTQAESDLKAQIEKVAECEAEIRACEEALLEASSALQSARDAAYQLRSVEENLGRARRGAALLGEVPCGGEGSFSACGFLHQAHADKASILELEARAGDLRIAAGCLAGAEADQALWSRALRESKAGLKDQQAKADALRALAAKLPVARAAESRIVELERELAEGQSLIRTRGRDLDGEEREAKMRAAQLGEKLKDKPAGAEEIRAKLSEVQAEGEAIKRDLAAAEEALRGCEAEATRAEVAEQRRAELGVSLETARGMEAEFVRNAGEWAVLERALGRDGIQALEIDAAGPELSSLTNELLTSCFGERFEVRFVTQIPKADGKGAKEVFDVAVIDHDRGREGSVDSLSGGEKTVVSEAISLALAIYVGKHSGRQFQTLFRDETAGQLDPDNAARYVAMLRRARVMAGAHQVFFIAQQPEVWGAADAVLWCEGGKVEVRDGC